MPNFQNGKIYAIRSHQTAQVYVGSTTQPLSVRFGGHRLPSNKLSSSTIMRFPDAYIELIENYPCSDKNELNRREGEFIRTMDCVNKRIAGRTPTEWRAEHMEELKQSKREWHANHREEANQRNKEWHADHREEANQKSREWHTAHREKAKQYHYDKKNMCVCMCGITYNIGHKSSRLRHYKSQKHMRFVADFQTRLTELLSH